MAFSYVALSLLKQSLLAFILKQCFTGLLMNLLGLCCQNEAQVLSYDALQDV